MTSKTIYKYPLEVNDIQKVEMPLYAEILTVQSQYDNPVIWAMVDTKQITEVRYFEIFGTGHPVPELDDNKERKYIGTFQMSNGNLVFHLFEIKRKL